MDDYCNFCGAQTNGFDLTPYSGDRMICPPCKAVEYLRNMSTRTYAPN